MIVHVHVHVCVFECAYMCLSACSAAAARLIPAHVISVRHWCQD